MYFYSVDADTSTKTLVAGIDDGVSWVAREHSATGPAQTSARRITDGGLH